MFVHGVALFCSLTVMISSHEELISGSASAVDGGSTPLTIRRSSVACAMSHWVSRLSKPRAFRLPGPVASVSPRAAVSLLLLGGVKLNPGPVSGKQIDSIRIGTLNVHSAVHKGPLIRDVISEHSLHVLIIMESWFSSDMPAANTDSCLPDGYGATHFFRKGHAGGVHDDGLKIGKFGLDFQACSFEYTGIKLTSGTGLLNVIGIYRPGSIAPTSAFFDEFSDFLARVNSPLPGKTVLSGDFNCPGTSLNKVDERLIEVTDLVNLTICDGTSTRMNHDGSPGNRLDLVMHNAAPDEIGDLRTFDVPTDSL